MPLDSNKIEVIDDQTADVLRRKTGAERLRIADEMYSWARRTLTSHLRSEHPDWDEGRVVREVARRLSHGAV